MSVRLRAASLPAAALVLVVGVLAIQVAHGGGRFEPLHPADACVRRAVTSPANSQATSQIEGIDGLTERLVLLGIDDAACTLHVSREALTLELARPGPRTDAEIGPQIGALHEGLLSAVARLDADGSLPPAARLVDEALDSADLNGFLKAAIRALPDSVVNAALSTDDVLTRTIDELDLRTLLGNIDDEQDLDRQVQAAVTRAVEAALVARVRDLL